MTGFLLTRCCLYSLLSATAPFFILTCYPFSLRLQVCQFHFDLTAFPIHCLLYQVPVKMVFL